MLITDSQIVVLFSFCCCLMFQCILRLLAFSQLTVAVSQEQLESKLKYFTQLLARQIN